MTQKNEQLYKNVLKCKQFLLIVQADNCLLLTVLACFTNKLRGFHIKMLMFNIGRTSPRKKTFLKNPLLPQIRFETN